MKVDLDHTARGYIRALLLERAEHCRTNADLSKKDGVKADWRDESAYASSLSFIVDAGEMEREPSQVDKRRDVDQVDAPAKEPSN